jgi:hypothetical protein
MHGWSGGGGALGATGWVVGGWLLVVGLVFLCWLFLPSFCSGLKSRKATVIF